MSTISRLESKYSDILSRRRRKENQYEKDDRDKTLEPEKPSYAMPLSRSATTNLTSATNSVLKKERTPYRLLYSDRKPISSATEGNNTKSSGSSSSSINNSYKSRPDLSLFQSSSSSSVGVPKSSQYESPIMRHKDSLYEAYNSRIPAMSRYNNYDQIGLSSSSGNAYGCYEGRDKENIYKSKYEPSRLYAELNNNDKFEGDRNASRYSKSYKRSDTNYNLYDNFLTSPSTSTRNVASTSRYAPRKSSGYQRSQTQKFFDSELSMRNVIDSNNNGDLYSDKGLVNETIKSEAIREREARRKEIQGLIAKYAQIDDVYHRATDNDSTLPALQSSSNNTSNDTNNIRQNSVLDSKIADKTNSNVLKLGLALPYTHGPSKPTFLPLLKTQSVSSMSSVNRLRIPKTSSTFVRS